MRILAMLAVLLAVGMFTTSASAQCGSSAFGASSCGASAAMAMPAFRTIQYVPMQAPPPPTTFRVSPSPVPQVELRETEAETNFLANGPRLYSMDKALQVSKKTGKPVICWMGKHLFSDERARKLSQELADTTIQAVMDGDGTPYDAIGPRLKFTNGNYGADAKTYYVRLADFDKSGKAGDILAKARGGSR